MIVFFTAFHQDTGLFVRSEMSHCYCHVFKYLLLFLSCFFQFFQIVSLEESGPFL